MDIYIYIYIYITHIYMWREIFREKKDCSNDDAERSLAQGYIGQLPKRFWTTASGVEGHRGLLGLRPPVQGTTA